MIELMNQWLEVLVDNGQLHPNDYKEKKDDAITSLRQAIAEAEQDRPVAWMTIDSNGEEDDIWYDNPEGKLLEGWSCKPLYTHPQPRKPVKFPTMIRRMWSGGEVQAWLDENVNKE